MLIFKKSTIRLLLLFAAVAIVAGCTIYWNYKIYRETYEEYTSVFEGGENIYYRIPGIVITDTGTLIAYCEERKELRDTSYMNIVCRRSTDNGKTWGGRIVIAEGICTNHTMNNPVMIADEKGGLHFIFTVGYGLGDDGGLYYMQSTDDGLSWSEPHNITDITKPDNWHRIASGPGHGIQLSNGTLIATVWMTEPAEEQLGKQAGQYYIAMIYSEDYGGTWQFGETLKSSELATGPNEAVIAELSDGTVMINTRIKGEQQYYRAVAYSDTGYSGWSKLTADENLIDPHCFGGMVSTGDSLLFVNNNSQDGRENLTVKASYDDGATWFVKKIIREEVMEIAGYADIAADDTGLIYVLYEECNDEVYSVKMCRFYTDYIM